MSRFYGLLPIVAWLVCLGIYAAAPPLRGRIDSTAVVALTAGSDVVSNVQALGVVLIWALSAALFIEPAKAIAPSRFGSRGVGLYLLLVFYQCVLVGDTVRAHLIDWWTWLGAWFGFGARVAANQHTHFPWFSLLMSCGIAALWYSPYISNARRATEATTRRPPLGGAG